MTATGLRELVEPARTALLVIDVQNDYCRPDGALGKKGAETGAALAMLPRLETFLDAARARGVRPVFIRTVHEPETDSAVWTYRLGGAKADLCRSGTWGAEFCGVAPLPGEPVVVKHRYSAFVNTRLESVLRTMEVRTVVACGVATNVCVESTVRDAFMRDYHVVLVEDCCAAYSEAEHAMTVENVRGYFGRVARAADLLTAWND